MWQASILISKPMLTANPYPVTNQHMLRKNYFFLVKYDVALYRKQSTDKMLKKNRPQNL